MTAPSLASAAEPSVGEPHGVGADTPADTPSARGCRPGPVALLLIGIVRVYQLVLSPWLPPSCRFEPSCSAYALEALRTHGAPRGGWLTLRRLGRCHPFCAGGYDPVPSPERRSGGRPAAPEVGPSADTVQPGSPDRGVPAC